MFYLFGVDHDGAQAYGGHRQPGHVRLLGALTDNLPYAAPTVVAEEMNEETLKGRTSVPREFALAHGFRPEFCEPDTSWRFANQCYPAPDIQRLYLGFRNEPYIVNNLGLAAEALDVAINYPKREAYWLEKLTPFRQCEVYFVLGYDHVDSFAKVLDKNLISRTVVESDIGVTPETKEYRRRVREFLQAHPELAESVKID